MSLRYLKGMMSPDSPPGDVATGDSAHGQEYLSFITGQLDQEVRRRDTIDARSAAVITASGAVLTLGVGVLAFLLGKPDQITGSARILVSVAATCFLLAVLGATVAGFGRKHQITSEAEMADMVDVGWNDPPELARRMCAKFHLEHLRSLRAQNQRKARFLTAALVLQPLGTLILLLAILLA